MFNCSSCTHFQPVAMLIIQLPCYRAYIWCKVVASEWCIYINSTSRFIIEMHVAIHPQMRMLHIKKLAIMNHISFMNDRVFIGNDWNVLINLHKNAHVSTKWLNGKSSWKHFPHFFTIQLNFISTATRDERRENERKKKPLIIQLYFKALASCK